MTCQYSEAGGSMPRPDHRSGFTLIEILVVLAIAGVLAVLVYPGYRESVTKARRSEGRAALAATMLEQERRLTGSGSYEVFSAARPNGFKWFSGSSASSSAYELSAAACSGSAIRDCVLLTASPGTALVNGSHRDPACGALTLDSQGTQGAAGPGPGCW